MDINEPTYDEQERIQTYAQKASEYLQDAGIRYLATYAPVANSPDYAVAMTGWVVAMEAAATRNARFLSILIDIVTGSQTPEEAKEMFSAAFPDRQDRQDIIAKVDEYAKLVKLGEG